MKALTEDFFQELAVRPENHAAGSAPYEALKSRVRAAVEGAFGPGAEPAAKPFPPFGELIFPYRRMGAIDSLDLFGLDEMIIFAFYWANRARYRRAVDIGANIGLHTLIMSRCGFETLSFEPDPIHYAWLCETVRANGCERARLTKMAVSDRAGEAEFVRVLGNTTGSHLAGAKKNPYGELERFPVRIESIGALAGAGDLYKIDAEGHEAVILGATGPGFWDGADALVEVGTPENARTIYETLSSWGVGLFPQKRGWRRARSLSDLPTSYKEGTLFISRRETMPWA